MDNELQIKLISYEGSTLDEDGNEIPIRKSRDVFASWESIGQQEFFDAGQHKLNPSFVLLVFRYDYQNEREVEVNGKSYSIYRTYVPSHGQGRRKRFFATGEVVELYCEERIANG